MEPRVAWVMVLLLAGCVPDFAVPQGAKVVCRTTADCIAGMLCTTAVCPAGATCHPMIGTCLPPGMRVAVVSGGLQDAVVDTAFAAPLAVAVTDEDGNPLSGVWVGFSAPPAGATAVLSSAASTTDASGRASVVATAGPVAGTYSVTAMLNDLIAAASFVLTNCGSETPFAEGLCGVVAVPAGAFWMGCNSAVDDSCLPDESPYHEVTLSQYLIDSGEVTQAAYKLCIDAGACTSPKTYSLCNWDPADKALYPVGCLSWTQAKAFCDWDRKRLPTEAEWEKAARGTDGRKYPWGNESATCERAVMNNGGGVRGNGCGTGKAMPVGSKPSGASPYGALDMAGNVWEWVSDWYSDSYYASSPSSDPQGPENGSEPLYRGGGFYDVARHLRVSYRGDYYDDVIGIRCAKSVP